MFKHDRTDIQNAVALSMKGLRFNTENFYASMCMDMCVHESAYVYLQASMFVCDGRRACNFM